MVTTQTIIKQSFVIRVFLSPGRLVQGLERDVRDLQAHAEHMSGSMAQMEEHLGTVSHSSQNNGSSLEDALARATASIHSQDVLLQETAGHVGTLRQRLEEVGWTVGLVNHSLSSDVNVQQLKMEQLQVQMGNVTQDTSSIKVMQVHLEEQLKNEIEILNVITEDLRLKDWEHSTALKNLTIIQGRSQRGLQLKF